MWHHLLLALVLSTLLVSTQSQITTYVWDSEDGDGEWTDERWSLNGFPNSTYHRAMVDVGFSIGTVNLKEQVTVSKLVIGPSCARVQITEVANELTKLTVETNPLDIAQIQLSGTIIEQPISISLFDPLASGRTATVTVTTELNNEVKMFQLTRPSTADGWFYGSFPTRNDPPCPEDPTSLCVNNPQEIFVTYTAIFDGEPIKDRAELACGDFADFKVEEVEWALTGKAVSANLGKLWDLYVRLLDVKTTLSEKDYVDNVNHYKTIAEESFVLGSSCIEEFCDSSEKFLHDLYNEGGTVELGHAVPLTREIYDQEEY